MQCAFSVLRSDCYVTQQEQSDLNSHEYSFGSVLKMLGLMQTYGGLYQACLQLQPSILNSGTGYITTYNAMSIVLQEVIVVEDENGNIVRESMKDNDVLMQYKTMRETLIYLSHLSHEDTENQMLEKLRMQMQVR